jgi:hypothetical protein
MKKTITLCLFLITVTIKAQIFTEDFNSGIPATFTLTDVDGSTPNSTAFSVGSFFANSLTTMGGIIEDCAQSVSWFNPVGQADDWMVTPAITLPITSNGISLYFDALGWEAPYPDGVEVYVSTTGTSPSDFTAPALYNTTNTGGEPDVWTTRTVSLNTYVGQTIYIAFRNNSNDMNILGIDNILVKEIQDDEAELTSLDIMNFTLAPATIDIKGIITNAGGNIINTIDLIWTDGINSYTDNLTNLNLAPGLSYNFTHADQLTMTTPGSANITVNIDLVNNNIDPNLTNNTLTASVSGLSFIPEKITVGEEKTGSWCGWCPRGAVALAEMESTSSFIGIAVHNGDPMTISSYDGSLGTYVPGGYPGGGVDRVLAGDPSDFSTMHASRVTDIVPCEVNSINAHFDGTSNEIGVSTEVEFFGEMNGDYRLSCVIVEDDLESTASGWAQANYYSGGGAGVMAFPSNLNGGYSFSNGADPAQTSDFGGYDHVARSLSNNDILGDVGSLPSGLINIGSYNHTFTNVNANSLAGYNDAGFNWTKAHAVVMIVNATTGEILNAQEVALTSSNLASSWDCDAVNGCVDPGTGLGQYTSVAACTAVCNTTSIQENNTSEFNIYPNPVKDVLTIDGIYNSVNIYDVFGKLVLTSQTQKIIDVSSLSNGVYMLEINTEQAVKTKKITVAK